MTTYFVPEIPEETEPDKLSLALEPEAAAIYCQSMTQQDLALYYAKDTHLYTSNAYMVVDISGGTVDISAHQVSSAYDHHTKVINTPAGNDCGGSSVNKNLNFWKPWLVTRISPSIWPPVMSQQMFPMLYT